MRTWPYQMISALPQKHLSAQWRECCAICGMVTNKDTGLVDLNKINHTTINRIKEYPVEHLALYTMFVYEECKLRGYKCRKPDEWVEKLYKNLRGGRTFVRMDGHVIVDDKLLWENFHNEYYFTQCMWMFQEKYMSEQINEHDWLKIKELYSHMCSINNDFKNVKL